MFAENQRSTMVRAFRFLIFRNNEHFPFFKTYIIILKKKKKKGKSIVLLNIVAIMVILPP